MRFDVVFAEFNRVVPDVFVPLLGAHNVLNTLSVFLVLDKLNADID